MSKHNHETPTIQFRAPAEFKRRLRTASLLNGQDMSEYIREKLEPILSRDIAAKRREILAETA